MFDAIKNFVTDLAERRQGRPAISTTTTFASPRRRCWSTPRRSTATCRDVERDKLRDLLKQRFELDDAAADELIEQAAAADEKAVDLYHFTRLLNDSLDDNERLRMIEMMWKIAYADGAVSRVRGQSDLARRRSARRVVDRADRAAPSRRRASAAADA